MAKKKEVTVEDKLRALYDLQLIDSRIDEIKNMRGELPLEVKDLEDEIAGLQTRLNNFSTDIENLETAIANKRNNIEEAKALSKKYQEQQKNVRNNREFDSISKEIEYQDLEIQLAEKHIREFEAKIAQKNEIIDAAKEKMTEKETHLKHKQDELNAIMDETAKEEKLLEKKSIEFSKQIDERLLQAYSRIRSTVRNGLAVVTIERGASGGSFFTIPPQRQVEIASRKKIITDEHSGRILIDSNLAEEEREKMSEYIG
ncbi:MAG: C4-type zinc ribbon domain-containing protein [Lutimonas sp.]